MNELAIIEDGSVWIEDGIIQAVGTTEELKSSLKTVRHEAEITMQQVIWLHRDSLIRIRMSLMAEVANVSLKCGLKVRHIWKL